MTNTLKVTCTSIPMIHHDPAEDGAVSGECKTVACISRETAEGDGDDPMAIQQRPLEWSRFIQERTMKTAPSAVSARQWLA